MSDQPDFREAGENFLEHFGKLGMKWGSRNSSGNRSPFSPDSNDSKVKSVAKSYVRRTPAYHVVRRMTTASEAKKAVHPDDSLLDRMGKRQIARVVINSLPRKSDKKYVDLILTEIGSKSMRTMRREEHQKELKYAKDDLDLAKHNLKKLEKMKPKSRDDKEILALSIADAKEQLHESTSLLSDLDKKTAKNS